MIELSEELLTEPKVTPAAKLFYAWLKKYDDRRDKANAHYADQFSVTTLTISNWLFNLEKEGYVSINYYKKNRTITITK